MRDAARTGFGVTVRVLAILLLLSAGLPGAFGNGPRGGEASLIDRNAQHAAVVELHAAAPQQSARPERDLPPPPPVLAAGGSQPPRPAGAPALTLTVAPQDPPAQQRGASLPQARAPPLTL